MPSANTTTTPLHRFYSLFPTPPHTHTPRWWRRSYWFRRRRSCTWRWNRCCRGSQGQRLLSNCRSTSSPSRRRPNRWRYGREGEGGVIFTFMWWCLCCRMVLWFPSLHTEHGIRVEHVRVTGGRVQDGHWPTPAGATRGEEEILPPEEERAPSKVRRDKHAPFHVSGG